MGIGEAAGLGAAALWACSSLIISRVKMTPMEINFWKNLLVTFVFLIHLWVVKSRLSEPTFVAPIESWCWLGLSSLIGIVIGDWFYLRSLQILGPRRALVVATTAPIFGIFVGYFFLGESITLILCLGIAMTIGGVAIVIHDKRAQIESPNLYPGSFVQGILLGVVAAICQATAVASAKIGMAHGCEALESSFIRICAGAVMTGMFLAMRSGSMESVSESDRASERIEPARSIFTPIRDPKTMKKFIPAALFGTWLGIWLFQIAQLHSDTAVVTTLVSTCPIFAIPLVWFFLGQRISLKGIGGTIVAVIGVTLVIML